MDVKNVELECGQVIKWEHENQSYLLHRMQEGFLSNRNY